METTGEFRTAKQIFGKLISIDRDTSNVLIEYKAEDDEWVTDSYDISTLTEEKEKALLSILGRDMYFRIVDNEVKGWDRP